MECSMMATQTGSLYHTHKHQRLSWVKLGLLNHHICEIEPCSAKPFDLDQWSNLENIFYKGKSLVPIFDFHNSNIPKKSAMAPGNAPYKWM